MKRPNAIASLTALAFALGLAACETPPTKEQKGTVAGAVVGGVVGSTIGGGTGRTVAIVAGTIAGAVIGGRIGQKMDERVVSREVRRAQLPEPKVQKGLVGVHRASGTCGPGHQKCHDIVR